MKNILLLALFTGFAALEAQPVAAQTTPSTTTSKADAKKARKTRKQTGPEVYKGTVAEQRRIVTDAPGAEKEDGDDTSTKKSKRNKE